MCGSLLRRDFTRTARLSLFSSLCALAGCGTTLDTLGHNDRTTGGVGGAATDGGSGTAQGGSGTARGGSGTTQGGSGTEQGGSGTARGGSGTTQGGSGTTQGGSGTAQGGTTPDADSGIQQGGSETDLDAASDASAPLSSPRPLTGPASYPNALREVLGVSDAEIADKIESVFQQLFHGDPATEAFYFAAGDEMAYIQDILHGDVRTEGMGYGMLVTVELNKRTEFDRLWRYARTALEIKSGPNRGYFSSYCDTINSRTEPCIDPFGHSLLVTALLFAEGRWGSAGSDIDYGRDAIELLHVMRNKEEENNGVQEGVTNMFDSETRLPFDTPTTDASEYTRPSAVVPAFYELWAQATGDYFWVDAADAGRRFWELVASESTGLMPVRAHFDGTPVANWDRFQPEGYRVYLNIVLDWIWFGGAPWEVDNSNRALRFFQSEGMSSYGRAYELDGGLVDPERDDSLVAVNGTTALIATWPARDAFIEALWNVVTPTDERRYYTGMLQLMGLMTLAGQLRVY